MAIIKAVSEIATKEFAANNGLDQLDKEVKAQEFVLHPYKETGVNIVLKLGELIQCFEEYQIRLQVLRSNPFVRNFFEKMQELDRVIRLSLETLQEWQVFQRKWIYLEEIFTLPEIRKQLEKEAKRFRGTIDAYFRACTKGFEIAIRVHVAV